MIDRKKSGEAIGAIPEDTDNQPIKPGCSTGFRVGPGGVQIATGVDLGNLDGEIGPVLVAADESTPMTENVWRRIVEELGKPRFAFERTLEGARHTRRIK